MKLFSLILIITSQFHADVRFQYKTVQISEIQLDLVDVPKKRLLISKGCMQKDGMFKCLAYSAFEKSAKSASKIDLTPPEIGAELCKKNGGVIVIAKFKNENENEISLCKFESDLSYIDLGSLFAS
jgi:hypothetical protein